MSKDFLRMTLEREKGEITKQLHIAYWDKLFKSFFAERGRKLDFYLVPYDLSVEDVSVYCRKVFSGLCKKYGLTLEIADSFARQTLNPEGEDRQLLKREFRIKILYQKGSRKGIVDDFLIIIMKEGISLRLYPYFMQIKDSMLEEYKGFSKMISELFEMIFIKKKDELENFIASISHIDECAEKLTRKSIEIAQNSIKTIYYQKDKSNHTSFIQRNLYTSFVVDGKVVRILHKDFLDNPGVLISLFEKKEEEKYVGKN